MASAVAATVSGVYSRSSAFKARSYAAATVGGVGSATGIVAWAGSSTKRTRIDWIPTASTPITLDGKTMNPVWYRAFYEVFNNRLGGLNAQTIPQIITAQTQTQDQVLSVQSGVISVGGQVSAITGAVNAGTQVAQSSGLSGASQIPILPSFSYGKNIERQ